MSDTIKVQAVDGAVLPVERGHGYVGYTQCAADDPEADHVIGTVCGLKRVLTPVEVQNTLYYRCAINVGDLVAVQSDPPPPELEDESETESRLEELERFEPEDEQQPAAESEV
jgi:hypothetical protein